MSQILLLQSSLNGPVSRTNQLMERFLQTRREQGHQDQVVVRDLTTLDLPVLDSPLFHALRGAEPANEAIRQAVALSALLFSTLLWARLDNGYVWIVLLVTAGFAMIGFADDYAKVTKHNTKGVSSRMRMLLGLGIAACAPVPVASIRTTSAWLAAVTSTR